MILSKTCIYGIQAAIYVAAESEGNYVSISVVAEKLHLSFHFLTKVLQQFTSAGLMTSYRGPKGGIALGRESKDITLYDMIASIDGTELFTECMLGLPGCGHAEPCPAHDHWVEVRQKFTLIAKNLTLQQLAKNATKLNVRLSDSSSVMSAIDFAATERRKR
ncbi:MAG: Rrf2 family transcriptional regulator [Ignavibacteria bacterium]|nr:Rrf2 family transcriptional regulator [Ignavibacteria bacterium]